MNYGRESVIDDSEPLLKLARGRPKCARAMNDDDVFKLITCVQSNECIWNLTDANYTNKNERRSAWMEIWNQLDCAYEETELRAKWSNLRIQYNRVCRRDKSSLGADFEPAWKFFNALSFLGPVDRAQKQETFPHTVLEESPDNSSGGASSPTFTKRAASPSFSKGPSNKRQHHDMIRSSSASAEIVNTLREAVAAIKGNKDNSANVNFCKYLLSELEQLSDVNAFIMRRELLNVLINYNFPPEHTDKLSI
ncbi:uncharacterized protein LOC115622803 [Scaptodrosophila lebanonensis]|uniref:Uncharacterized protein LOC115622803 n=1 Tax=Drosophila lebanonensis TaxID=7225 RepID=A0A6J2T719_DROLE|nr:uncharacterized protein LOC115622803 [Scaptodrosophila lebanonensis]